MKFASAEVLDPLRKLAARDARERSRLPFAITNFLAEISDQQIPPECAVELVACLAGISRSEQRRLSESLQALAANSPAIVEALEKALRSADPELRWGAAYTLGKFSPENSKIWPPIQEMLAAEDGDSRWAAAEITCAIARESASVQEELRQATRGPGATLRRMALYCLRDLRAEGLHELARERLDDPDGHGRLSALTTLTTTEIPQGDKDALARKLVSILNTDPVPGVRRASAATIGKLHLYQGRDALEKAAESKDPSLARAARQAIHRWSGK